MSWMVLTLTHARTSTTIDLVDDLDFSLVSWAPTLSYERDNRKVGGSRYASVQEAIAVDLMGTDALTNYNTLSWLLDMAGRDNEVVTLRVQAKNSTLGAPIECQVIGRGRGAPLRNPATFNEELHVYWIRNVVIDIERNGLYLGAVDTASAGAATNPSVLTDSFSEELRIPGPTKVSLTLSDSTDGLTKGFVVVSDYHVDDIDLIAADTLSGSPATVDESALFAFGGDVIEQAATSQAIFSYYKDYSPVLEGYDSIAFLVSARNLSTTVSWLIRISTSYAGSIASTRWRRVDISTTNPRYFNLGTAVHASGKFERVQIDMWADQTNASEKIRIDTIACIPFGKNTRIVRLREINNRDIGAGTSLIFDHRALTANTPIAKLVQGTTEGHMAATSHSYLETEGQDIATIFLVTKATRWTFTNDANSAKQTVSADFERYKSYLGPQ